MRWIAVALAIGLVLWLVLGSDDAQERATDDRQSATEKSSRSATKGSATATTTTKKPSPPQGKEPQLAITGRVVDAETNASIPDARVYAKLKGSPVAEVKSDGAGRFALVGVDKETRYRIDAAAPGYASALVTASAAGEELGASAGEEIDVPLRRGLLVHGRVEDDAGRPLAGATVAGTSMQFQNGGFRHIFVGGSATEVRAETDGHGRFALDQVIPVGKSTFKVRLDGYQEGSFQIEAKKWNPDEKVVVRLKKVAVVRGRVLGPDGRPLESVAVVAADQYAAKDLVRTDADGRFAVPWKKGAVSVLVWAKEHVPQVKLADPENELEVRLARTVHVGGVVVDDLDRAVAGAGVRVHHYRVWRRDEQGLVCSPFVSQLSVSEPEIRWWLMPYRKALPEPEAVTDAVGRFRLRVGAAGKAETTLAFEKAGHVATQAGWERAEMRVRLPRTVRVELVARDAATGAKIARFRVLYRVAGSKSSRGGENPGDEKTFTAELRPGRYSFTVNAKGYREKTTDAEHLLAGETRNLEVHLERD